jgi:hypothetical protein
VYFICKFIYFSAKLSKTRIYFIFIYQIAKRLFDIMSLTVSNIRAFSIKVVELCVVEKCVFSAFFGGVWVVAKPGRS